MIDKRSTAAHPSPPVAADHLSHDLRALLVAINPSTQSAAIGYPFSSPTNPFWRLLHESGLTATRIAPAEAHRLTEYGLGLTTTVRRATPASIDLTVAERRAGADSTRAVIDEYRPRVVALLGLTLFPLFLPNVKSQGAGLSTAMIGDAAVFVLPNPSGRNRAFPGFERKLVWYRALADLLAVTE